MINNILEMKKEGIKYISVDIFDTLIFRTVSKPQKVFEIMFDEAKELFVDYINEKEWRIIRVNAEKRARDLKFEQTENGEVDLTDIYNCMPSIITNIEELKRLELKIEKDVCVLNLDIYNQLKQIKQENNCKLIAISDMYLSKNEICDLLEYVGVENDFFENIYVSSEIGKSKKNGDLFELVMKDLGINSDEIIHCGDNIKGDIARAESYGIKTYYYNVISEAKYRHSCFEMESIRYKNIAQEIFAIRNLAGSHNPYESEKGIWYEMGAMILGPLFTYSMEWVIDMAEENNIKHIYPLMREGKLLSKLLNNILLNRKSDIEVKPLYISRKVIYDALKENVTENEVINVFETVHYTVKELFEYYDIVDISGKYKKYFNYEIHKLRDIILEEDDISLYEDLKKYLCSDDVLNYIREKHKDLQKSIKKYFKQVGIDDNFITVDIGWHGRIPSGIQKLLDLWNMDIKTLNLFICGKQDVINNIYRDVDIRGYVGSFGKNIEDIMEICAVIMEMLSMCDEGTTIGYIEKSDGVYPIQKEVEKIYKGNQINNIKILQEGILEFQKVYFQYKDKNDRIKNMKYKENELCEIVGRLFVAPSIKEAKLLGSLEYDVNMGSESVWKIIEHNTYMDFCDNSIDRFFSKEKNRYVEWISGMNVIKDPFLSYKVQCVSRCKYYSLKMILYIERILRELDGKFILVGAGNYGKDMYKFFNYIDKSNRIECFIDNDELLQGNSIFGIPIKSMNEDFKTKNFIICTVRKNFINQFTEQIRTVKGEDVTIISYYN